MDRQLLKDVLLSQAKRPEERIVPRTAISALAALSKTPFIVIVSGVRRCGKSTLLQAIRDDACYYINFDDERLVQFSVEDFRIMQDLLVELFGEKDIFIFDEVQNVPGWERFVRRLHDQHKKVYISGSNASMLSKELGTRLTGRTIQIRLFPFSFAEYLAFKEIPKGTKDLAPSQRGRLKRAYNEYLIEGGFPEYLKTQKEEYLRSLYENILYRDIIVRYKLPSEKAIKETAIYSSSNIAKELSYNTIKNLTGLSSATTVKEYLQYLENSYLVFLIPLYSPSLKKQTYSPKKAYLIDTCLARLLGFRPTEDAGRMMENAVFLSLKRKYDEIYFHKGERECDFIVRKDGVIHTAIQVTISIHRQNRDREIQGLIEALRRYHLKEGVIITEDQSERVNIRGKTVSIVPIWRWLLENEF